MTSHLHKEDAGNTSAQEAFVAFKPDDSHRILSLDVLRGIAVLGALAVSIWVFGGFSVNRQIQLLTHPSGGNYRLFATVSLLLEGKMLALICMVFGAGLVLYMTKHQQADINKAHDYMVRRQMWLIGFGIINAILFLWPYDVLFQLGVAGILLIPFLHLSPKKLLIAASVAALIFLGKQYWNYSDDHKALKKYEAVMVVEKKIKQDSINMAKKDSIAKVNQPKAAIVLAKDSASGKAKKDSLTKEQVKDKESWEGMLKTMKYDPKNDSGKIKSMRNTSYGELWNHLLPLSQGREAQWTYRIGVWEFSMLCLIGMALLKMGFFSNRLSLGKYLLIAAAGISIGLLLGWFRLYYNNATLLNYTKYIKSHLLPYNFFIPFEISVMAVGYAGLVIALIRSRPLAWIWKALADTGRLSLTNYLVQCIFCTLFFTGFGINNYSKLNQLALYVVVAEIWLVQIVFSVLWLRHFTMGPAEWLWHSLVEKQKLPIIRQTIAIVPSPVAVQS